jgi:hypothetical protein
VTVLIDELPARAADASQRLCEELRAVLGDDLIAVWVHGGTTFADRSARGGDIDVCAAIASVAPSERAPRLWHRDPSSRPSLIRAAEMAIASQWGVAFDATYLLAGEMGADTPPPQAFDRAHRVHSWPVFRAHWLAGQFSPLHGRRPNELIVAPSPRAMRVALDREIEHLERHVAEGDAADPDEATYGILNSCRILYTLETGSPVLSKQCAGDWGLVRLPPRWQDAIRAAQRWYDGAPSVGDQGLLREAMPAFVGMVREQLPATNRRRARPPRWS